MTLGNDNGTDGQTDRQTNRRTDRVRRNMRPSPREEGRIIIMSSPAIQQVCDILSLFLHPLPSVASLSEHNINNINIKQK